MKPKSEYELQQEKTWRIERQGEIAEKIFGINPEKLVTDYLFLMLPRDLMPHDCESGGKHFFVFAAEKDGVPYEFVAEEHDGSSLTGITVHLEPLDMNNQAELSVRVEQHGRQRHDLTHIDLAAQRYNWGTETYF